MKEKVLALSKQKTETDEDAIERSYVCHCKCGSVMEPTLPAAVYGDSAQCDGCGRGIAATDVMYHCTAGSNIHHMTGFDFCVRCAEKTHYSQLVKSGAYKKQQTQNHEKKKEKFESKENNVDTSENIDKSVILYDKLMETCQIKLKRQENYLKQSIVKYKCIMRCRYRMYIKLL